MPEGAQPLPDAFARALAEARPRLGVVASIVHYYPTVGSTNDVATALIEAARGEGAVVVADAQTAGRGRRGRVWFSPPTSGLYASLVLTPECSRADGGRATALIPLAAGVALAEAVRAVTGLAVDLKWPNDLYVGRKKLGGILAEAVTGDDLQVVLGYGINVRTTAYPPELRDRATSLDAEMGQATDRVALFVETLVAVARRHGDLLAGRYDDILDAWRAHAPASEGATVTWMTREGPRSGVTAGLDTSGALLVRTDAGLERLVAGEVLWA